MSDEIRLWLKQLELDKYYQAFVENEITQSEIRDLNDDDLKELGLPMGPRKRLLRAISEITKPASKADNREDTTKSTNNTPAADRRQLTVMFCDLVDSTSLSGKLDPEDLRDVMRSYQDAVAGAVTRYGGHIAKYLGDGVLVYFGWPQAYEDQAERAVRAGLDAISAVSSLTLENVDNLAARVGIATGLVIVGDLVGETGRDSEAVSGQTPNLAARLQNVAKRNQLVIGTNTRKLIGTLFNLENLGKCDLKGFSDPVAAWKVVSEAVGESRFEATRGAVLAPFVGREHELELLLERWELVKGAEGQVVELSGEAGIGKSRIVRALLDAVGNVSHFRLRYQCSSYHKNSAYFPIIHRLEQVSGFASTDTVEERLDKLEEVLRLSGKDIDDHAPWFADLLSLPGEKRYGKIDLTPQKRRENITNSLIAQVLALSKLRPVLFIVEDGHWLDPTTKDLLDQLALAISSFPVLMLITYRKNDNQSLANYPYLTSLTLNRLSRANGRQIIQEVGGEGLSGKIIDQIVSRADGVPLYVEEITRSVVEAEGKTNAANIPETLQDLLMERLDRLGEAKEVIQVGAVIGREFDYELLASVVDLPAGELSDILQLIVRSELVSQRGTSPSSSYIFKHALVQDTAYQSLLNRKRKILHEKVASTLEDQSQEATNIQPEVIAYHYSEAKLAEKSVPFWLKAGQQALERSANLEAIAHLTKGRRNLAKQEECAEKQMQDLEFCLSLGPALMSTKGLAAVEAEEIYLHARNLCQSVAKQDQSFHVTWGLWLIYQQRGEIDKAQSAANELLALADQHKENVACVLQAHHAAWTTKLFVGSNSESHKHTQIGNELYNIEKHGDHAFTYGGHDPGVCAKTTSSEALCLLGYCTQAVEIAMEGVSLAEKLSHPFSLAMARYFVAQVHQYRLEPKTVLTHAQEAIIMCESHGFESFRAQATVLFGWARAATGQSKSGIKQIREGLADLRTTGTGMRRPYFLSLLADALYRDDQLAEGLKIVGEAESLIESSGENRWQAETLRLKGVLMEKAGAKVLEIENIFQHALGIAKSQEARILQIRTAASLACHLSSQGRVAEARDLLDPIYAWFKEGFDTPDLIQAKALLNKLK